MRLVIINEQHVIVADYGDFGVAEAEAFFKEAISAIEFRREFPKIIIRNELQLRMLTDTLAQMGLLHGNPESIQDWMRPYITNEIKRLNRQESLCRRARIKIAYYQQKALTGIKSVIFGSVSKILSKILTLFKK